MHENKTIFTKIIFAFVCLCMLTFGVLFFALDKTVYATGCDHSANTNTLHCTNQTTCSECGGTLEPTGHIDRNNDCLCDIDRVETHHFANETGSCFCGATKLIATAFPDPSFLACVQVYDENKDGVLSREEFLAVTEMDVSSKGITHISGIHSFVNLKKLSCQNNVIKDLDLFSNMALEEVNASGNELTTVNLPAGFKGTADLRGQQLDVNISQLDMNFRATDVFRDATADNVTFVDATYNAGYVYVQEGATQVSFTKHTNVDNIKITGAITINNPHSHVIAGEFFVDSTHHWQYCNCNLQIKNQHAFNNKDVCSCGSVKIGEIAFPDQNFLAYVQTKDLNNDGLLASSESNTVGTMSLGNSGIKSLEGIQHFKNLTYLNCNGLGLDSLDVSQNFALQKLECQNNNLTSLDISANVNLQELDCIYNQLQSLDVSNLTSLQTFNCSSNTQLSSLTLGNLPNLTMLAADYTSLTQIDLSGISAVKSVYLSNGNFAELDFSGLVQLREIYCQDNPNLTSINLDGCTGLVSINCYNTLVSNLDLTDAPLISSVSAYNCNLTSIDLSNKSNLKLIQLHENNLTSIDLTNSNAITYLKLSDNSLTELDLSDKTLLNSLDLAGNSLTELDLSDKTLLNSLDLAGNSLTKLVLPQTAISWMYLNGQKLYVDINQTTMSLDLSQIVLDLPNFAVTSDGASIVDGVLLVEQGVDSVDFEVATNVEGQKLTGTITINNPHTHVFSDSYSKNDTHHWYACACGVKNGEVAHIFDTDKKDGTHHWTECVCTAKDNLQTHNYQNNVIADNKVSDATCTQKTLYKKSCACGVVSQDTFEVGEVDSTNHIDISQQKDDTHHWSKCDDCNAILDKKEHNFGDDNVCDICKFEAATGLSPIAIVGIAVGGTAVAGISIFVIIWFVVKKKSFADLIKIFKK